MSNNVMIEIKDLSKSFKDVEVLKGMNLQVEKGQIFALLGSNGAGKTTTIKILSTLLKPDNGEVKLAGFNVVTEPKEVKKHIALTGQYAAVDEILTARENLHMMGSLLHVKNRKEKVEGLLKQFDLLDAGDRRASTYSGGMRRKLDIAMSLIGNPSIIFLDEPTTGLDPQSRKTMWQMIKELSDSGVTIFLTTQYLDEAEALADKIVILDQGTIVAEGTNDELKDIIAVSIVNLIFKCSEDALKAQIMLSDYNPVMDENNTEIKLETHDNVDEIMTILSKLKASGIEIENFEKKKASLEDVFLEIIKAEEEMGVYDVAGF